MSRATPETGRGVPERMRGLSAWLRNRSLSRRGVQLRDGVHVENVRFRGTALIEPDCRLVGDPEIVLGDRFYLNACSEIRGDVVFGDDVLIGPKAVIWDRCDPTHPDGHERAPVRIGDDVWLAAACVVMGGVTIGSGAVVGAGAVVSEDLPEGAIAVGNPARIVRWREPGLRAPAERG